MSTQTRRAMTLALSLATTVGAAAVVVSSSSATSNPGDEPPVRPTPQAACNAASKPETGVQGRVPAADFSSGRAAKGYTCNASEVSSYGKTGGFKVHRYVDSAGRICAYYDSTRLFPADVPYNFGAEGTGVVVLNMNKPKAPRKTANLVTPGMQSPHESLVLNTKRGLLAGITGNLVTEPGVLDLYDVSVNCRKPQLLSSTPTGILGHESGFARDGKTLYVSSTFGQTLTAVDVTNPTVPEVVTVRSGVNFHGLRLSRNGNLLYAADLNNPDVSDPRYGNGGIQILDVSAVQAREALAQMPTISELTWRQGSIAQVAEPLKIGGKKYLLQIDEFANFSPGTVTGGGYEDDAPVGAARLINVEDPKNPRVVSNLRLKVHQLSARASDQRNDPGATSPTQGYTGHYCSAPKYKNPGIVGCSMILSGLRIFDVSNPRKPREVAYFNKPGPAGGNALSAPAWDLTKRLVMYTDGDTGFHAVKLAKRSVPQRYWSK